MDSILCDELLQEIFYRLPPSSSPAVSLVSKRWLRLLRSSTVALSLSFSNPLFLPSLSSFLSHHPYLSSLSLSNAASASAVSSDHLLHSVSFSCPNLRHLRFLSDPVSHFSLLSLSTSCLHLSSLSITLSRPLCFQWLPALHSLKDLSIVLSGNPTGFSYDGLPEILDAELNLEYLCLSGSRGGDYGLNFLWRNCKKVKKLKLKSCESVGDNASFSAFIKELKALQEVELRTCRSIADGVLLKLAENSVSLNSLLVYDGGSKDGLLQFINQYRTRSDIQNLDVRLPLDLDNDHLMAIAENFRSLLSLRLQSCCLVTGEGLKAIGRALSDVLRELALINCDVVERESGLLTTLGQNLKRLRKLDLSYNEMLLDKELSSMVISCGNLSELKLRGCNRLTNVAMVSMARSCKLLEIVDIMYCSRIESEAVELFLLSSSRMIQLQIEESKLSAVARTLASDKFIKVVA
ncbi:hypothetical protein ACH5RR_011044 [Cinchona calisaya]|uniref:F-box domain-containing protein n=1 Tax=Cinchona calisaya TaxID=153742 RepID=A0ABD3A593_9GENT